MAATTRAVDCLGRLGQPEPVASLASRRWDAIVVGAGHNGLACAAYLARAGKRVLVVEARERVGGACTLETVWPGYRTSPCAYLLGLLHPLVIAELRLKERGLRWVPASAGMFVPFPDGSSLRLGEDDAQCEAEIRALAPGDLAGWRAMVDVKRRLRDALRPDGAGDLWVGDCPPRAAIEARLMGDDEARRMLFEWSMVEYVERYLDDERMQMAYLGQGVIGTNASPHDPGTASIHFHHASGRLGGEPGMWGYVVGGMGMVSFLALRRREATKARSSPPTSPSRGSCPGEGVELASGERTDQRTDRRLERRPGKSTLRLLGDQVPIRPGGRNRVESVPIVGCTVKMNVALRELPDFTGLAPGPARRTTSARSTRR